MEQILVQTLHGLVNGMVLAMVASGLTLIFGIMDIVNFAHGDLLMLGAFVGASVLGMTGNYWLALAAAAIVIAVLGALLQISTLRPLIGRDPLTTILATFGVSLVIQKYALWQWGPSVRRISEPVISTRSAVCASAGRPVAINAPPRRWPKRLFANRPARCVSRMHSTTAASCFAGPTAARTST